MQDEYGTEYAVYEKTAVDREGEQVASCDDSDTAHDIAEFFNRKPRIHGSHYYVVTIEPPLEDTDE